MQGADIPIQEHHHLCMCMCTREGCGLDPHVLRYIECTTTRARVANKCCLILT